MAKKPKKRKVKNSKGKAKTKKSLFKRIKEYIKKTKKTWTSYNSDQKKFVVAMLVLKLFSTVLIIIALFYLFGKLE